MAENWHNIVRNLSENDIPLRCFITENRPKQKIKRVINLAKRNKTTSLWGMTKVKNSPTLHESSHYKLTIFGACMIHISAPVVHNILEEDCWKRLPSSVWEVTALHLIGLRKINEILDRYEVNGDFLVKEEYPSLRYELLGAITDIIDGYEL